MAAATRCFAADPDASVQTIALAAGVGRATLYGHFRTRAELIDAALAHTLTQAEASLSRVDVTSDPRAALGELIRSSWRVISRYRSLLAAAERELPAERIRASHQGPMLRVHHLLARGQEEGVLRQDLPVDWLVAVFYHVLHGAANEVSNGRLDEECADAVLTATLFAAFQAGQSDHHCDDAIGIGQDERDKDEEEAVVVAESR